MNVKKQIMCDGRRIVTCDKYPVSCKYHEKCDWCNGFHFVKDDPRVEPEGSVGSSPMPSLWPLKYFNIACGGRRPKKSKWTK